jgi:hypothetical protein
MPRRPCLDCGTPTDRAGSRCARCASARNRIKDAARGNRHQRGYDSTHDRLREQWKPQVERGVVSCARCAELIPPGSEWALDHTDDRTGYLGPSHKACNSRAGGQAAHR